ncbi:MAG TPA: hypothetical protein VMW48_10760 [Vicinamibacterales bacterium]|nr:hypothetical protein [Vicinamibacterales bacterium]
MGAEPMIYFGSAQVAAWNPQGREENWQNVTTNLRRPEELGADVHDLGGRVPRPWTIQAKIYGNSAAELWWRYEQWRAAEGTIALYVRTGTAAFLGAYVKLVSVTPIDMTPSVTGTISATLFIRIQLQFERVGGTD